MSRDWKASSVGTELEYRKNTVLFARMVRNPRRIKKIGEEQHIKELLELQRMTANLFEMQQKIEKKIVKKEGDNEEQPDDEVTISNNGEEVTVTTPKKPAEIEDPDSLVTSPQFKDILKDMPVPVVEKRKVDKREAESKVVFFKDE